MCGPGVNRPSISGVSGSGGSGSGSGGELDCGIRTDVDEFQFNGGLRTVGTAFLDLAERV